MAWDMHKNMVGLVWFMGSRPSPIDNWISNSNTDINKHTKPAEIYFNSKRPS